MVDDLAKAFTRGMSVKDQDSIRRGGSADIKLQDGTYKSPDASFFDETPAPQDGKKKESEEDMAAIQSNPTMIWEIAMSQSAKQLARACGRFISASASMVNTAVGLCVECGRASEKRLLKKITVSVWILKDFYFTEHPTPEDLAKCGIVRRLGLDGITEEDDEAATTPAKYFIFSSYDGVKISNWKAFCKTDKLVSPFRLLFIDMLYYNLRLALFQGGPNPKDNWVPSNLRVPNTAGGQAACGLERSQDICQNTVCRHHQGR